MQDSTVVPNKQIELTQEGLEELQGELKELKEVKLPEVIKRVAQAREHGDLSENAEYHSARDDQQLIETRIEDLESLLSNAKIVKSGRATGKAGIGSTVVVHNSKDPKKQIAFYIVGEFEAEPMENKISTVSPIGKALVGKKKGDEVEVKTPAGSVTYVIEDVK